MILHHEDLEVLHWVFPKQSHNLLPSWVPDWADLCTEASGYNGDEHKFSSSDPQVVFSSNDQVISVISVNIGTIDLPKPLSPGAKSWYVSTVSNRRIANRKAAMHALSKPVLLQAIKLGYYSGQGVFSCCEKRVMPLDWLALHRL
jgi:hypothetical protein